MESVGARSENPTPPQKKVASLAVPSYKNFIMQKLIKTQIKAPDGEILPHNVDESADAVELKASKRFGGQWERVGGFHELGMRFALLRRKNA